MRATNSSQLRGARSVDALLQFAWHAPAFTASDAIEATGLTRATVISSCSELVERGWIRELENSRAAGSAYTKGRPARRYEFCVDAGVVVGIDAGQHRITVLVSDLVGKVRARLEATIDPEVLPEQRLAAVDDLLERALAKAGSQPDQVLCLCIGVPAPVDEAGRSPHGHNEFWPHMNPGYVEHFAKRGLIAVVENDANLAAIAEGARGAGADTSSYVTLLSGERFGAGYVVDGRLMRGARGGAGEMQLLNLVSGVGSADGIGYVARLWLQTDAAAGKIPAASELAGLPSANLGARRLFQAAEAGDSYAEELVDKLAERLARIFAVLSGLLDVERIIVAGAVATSLGTLVEHAQSKLGEFIPEPHPRLAASRLGADIVSLGALARGVGYIRDHALGIEVPSR